MKKSVFVFSVFILMLIACNSKNDLQIKFQSDLTQFSTAYNNQNWQKVTDMMYPQLFMLIPRFSMISTLSSMANKGLRMTMHNVKVESISDILESKKERFCKLNYSVVLKFELSKEIIEQNELLKNNLESLYGKKNVTYDFKHTTYTVVTHQSMMAISPKDKEDWKYLELRKEMSYILNQLLPIKVRTTLLDN